MEIQPAQIWKRIVASILDLIIVITCGCILIYLVNIDYPLTGFEYSTLSSLYKVRGILIGTLFDALYTIFLMDSSFQATLGMKVMKIKLIKLNGNYPSFFTCVSRYLISVISSIFIKLGYIFALFNKRNQTFHDYMTNTLVIDTTIFSKSIVTHENSKENKVDSNNIGPKNSIENSQTNLNEEEIWEILINEYESKQRKKGLHTKFLVESDGDESNAKIKYLKERYEQVRKEFETRNSQYKEELTIIHKNNNAEDDGISISLIEVKNRALKAEEKINRFGFKIVETRINKDETYWKLKSVSDRRKLEIFNILELESFESFEFTDEEIEVTRPPSIQIKIKQRKLSLDDLISLLEENFEMHIEKRDEFSNPNILKSKNNNGTQRSITLDEAYLMLEDKFK